MSDIDPDALSRCAIDGCVYVGRADRAGWGSLCKGHDYRLQKHGDPLAVPLAANTKEPTYDEIVSRRQLGNLSRNADDAW